MKDFVKKLIIINLLIIGIAGITICFLTENIDPGWGVFNLIVIAVISIVYSVLFISIDLIRPATIKYVVIYNLLYVAFLIIVPISEEFFNFSWKIFGDYFLFYSPILFLLVYLIYVLYKNS